MCSDGPATSAAGLGSDGSAAIWPAACESWLFGGPAGATVSWLFGGPSGSTGLCFLDFSVSNGGSLISANWIKLLYCSSVALNVSPGVFGPFALAVSKR